MEGGMKSIYGIGNPLMDVVAHVGFDFLKDRGKPPGSMNLIDSEESEKLIRLLEETRMVPGGSCANTLRGIAWLQRRSRFVTCNYSGAVGNDRLGDLYMESLREFGVNPILAKKKAPTGVSVILVTPDHERTMFTHLGACRYYNSEDTNYELLAKSQYLYFVGFMWDTDSQKRAIMEAVAHAKEHGVRVVFDLAGPFVVKRYHNDFYDWIPGSVDILTGNREEFRALTGSGDTDGDIIAEAGKLAPILVMKRGEKGCIVLDSRASNTSVSYIDGYKVDPVDTTGAGDAFAAGLLYGLLSEKSIQEAADLGNRLASSIVTVEGCDYESLGDGI